MNSNIGVLLKGNVSILEQIFPDWDAREKAKKAKNVLVACVIKQNVLVAYDIMQMLSRTFYFFGYIYDPERFSVCQLRV